VYYCISVTLVIFLIYPYYIVVSLAIYLNISVLYLRSHFVPKILDTPYKMNVPSNATTNLEYDLFEDLKITKANIYLFELMNLPQIHENFIKTLQGKTAKNSKEVNVGGKKGTSKYSSSDDAHAPKS
jgi:hypothetical protein